METPNIKQAFEAFMEQAFEKTVDSSTKASWGGSGYSVELFDDGTYRVLWDNNIGNLYDSPGLILSVPSLTDEEWDEDPDMRWYENAKEDMQETFRQHWEINFSVQAVIADIGALQN